MKLLIITQKVDENDQLLGFFIEWLKRFAKKFERITILCLEKGTFKLPENVKVISLGKEKFVNWEIENSLKIENWKLKILRRFLYIMRFYKYILKERRNYDAVFVHMNPIWMAVGGFCWKIMGKKQFLWYTSKGVTFKLKVAEKFADKIFTASPESFRLKSKKVIVTGHGIDTRLFQPISKFRHIDISKCLKILSVGRIAPVKNYETLIDAAKILKDGGVDFSVTMIGEAALDSDVRYLASLKFKVKSLKLEDNFSFIGKINHKELPSYYQSHDIFVHLSKTGSLDKTVLEAMACGMNVLSSNDSSRAFLPANLIFDENDPVELAPKILTLKNTVAGSEFREYVVRNHGLENLIDRLAGLMT